MALKTMQSGRVAVPKSQVEARSREGRDAQELETELSKLGGLHRRRKSRPHLRDAARMRRSSGSMYRNPETRRSPSPARGFQADAAGCGPKANSNHWTLSEIQAADDRASGAKPTKTTRKARKPRK